MLIAGSVLGKKGFVLVVLLSGALTFTGCHSGARSPVHGRPSAGNTMVSVDELGSLLGLTVSDASPTFITLKDRANTVMLFTFSNGQFYVNGKTGGAVGPLKRDERGLLVQRSLAERIRPYLDAQTPSVPSPRPSQPRRGLIVIDPGHGGKDPGAVSTLGYYEKEVNLAVARYLEGMLRQKGFATLMTRQSDLYVSLEERAAVANLHAADLFVSVHADSVDSSSPNGFTVYVARVASSRSTQVAQSIIRGLSGTGTNNRGLRKANYQVLVKTRCPAVLIELGYVSNPWEAQRLREPDMQRRLAQAIATGIERFADRHRI